MKFGRLILILAVAPSFSACAFAGCGCICHDGAPPRWSNDVELGEGDAFLCKATMTRGSNVIEFDFNAGACTKIGGDASFDAGDDACEVGYEKDDGGANDFSVSFELDAKDEMYLGGLDFDLTVTCQAFLHQSHETFSTTQCEC